VLKILSKITKKLRKSIKFYFRLILIFINFMEKEIENSQLEQQEVIVYLEQNEKSTKEGQTKIKRLKEFVKPFLSSMVFITILKLPLLVMAKESGSGKTPPPNNPNDSPSFTLTTLVTAGCTLGYYLWKGSTTMSFGEFIKRCVESAFWTMGKGPQPGLPSPGAAPTPGPAPASGPGGSPPTAPGGSCVPPPAFLNSLQSSPYAMYIMGGSIILIAVLCVYSSLNSKDKEEYIKNE
jgi:hypothetical protein